MKPRAVLVWLGLVFCLSGCLSQNVVPTPPADNTNVAPLEATTSVTVDQVTRDNAHRVAQSLEAELRAALPK